KDKDKTAPIFTAPDKEELLTWLAQQPLLAEHDEFVMCHAGISPQWNLKTGRKCAREVERIIQSEELPWLLKNMYSNQPDSWDDSLQ
ncbi:bis(5'-nucleosyl)-tetraphosphatase, partial [Vibrio parahaemolyticus]|nr:bis(5'-nucleosyl)-tetraphosphatase [Vibrio parahaemolyticus]